MKLTVVGAGAIGGLLASRLARTGQDVSLFARGRTLAALQADGLRVIEHGATTTVRLNAAHDARALGIQDALVIAVKGQALPGLAAALMPMIGPGTLVVSAMNGVPWWFCDGLEGPLAGQRLDAVDPGGAVSAALPAAQAIGCVVHISASTDAPGVVRHGHGNKLVIGAAHAALDTRAAALAAMFAAAGFDASASSAIRQDIWHKLWGNMNMNPISALTGSTADVMLDDPLTLALIKRMMEEALAVGAPLGLSTGATIDERIVVTRKLGAFKTSMLQDLEAQRGLEIEPILGVFPELGRKLGVPTPFCDAVLGLLRQRAANSGL